MPFALSAGQPRGWASSCRAQARGGRRLAASIAVDGRAALPSGGWVAAGCHLSSSNVPGWVVSQPWWLVSGVVAFRRRFESPRAYRPAPRKRGACAADESRGTTGASPHPPALPHPGKGARGHVRCGGERAAGDDGPGIQAKRTHARKNPQAHRESTPPEGTGKFSLDKLSAVVVQLSARGRIGSGVTRCPPASGRGVHERQKPGRSSQPSGLLFYPPLPTSAALAASNAPNATKPPYFVAFTRS